MSANAAQAIWCQWPLAERLALLMRWQTTQSLAIRTCLSLLPEQASAAAERSTSPLPDGRRLLCAYGPVGDIQLCALSPCDPGNAIAHLIWACALGNAVCMRSDDQVVLNAVSSLQELLASAEPDLADLVRVMQADREYPSCIVRSVTLEALHVVVAPSADVPLLIKDAMQASRDCGLVLWVNHALHHEVKRRIPTISLIDNQTAILQPVAVGDFYLAPCGAVAELLKQLQRQSNIRTALYSGDWLEVETASDVAIAYGAKFAVNTVDAALLGLHEARAQYQQPSLTVISHASK